MNKRGLSTVITTLIIVLLVLIAVGIVWVVIRNIIEQGTEDIDLGKFTINLQVKQITVNPSDIGVTVKRNPGKGELTGIKFLVSDGVQTQEFEETTAMGELGEQTFNLPYSGLVKEVENINGLISWWKLDGDANDEMGNNPGTIVGADCNVAGQFGNACYFDGVGDYINIPNPLQVFNQDSGTWCSWASINSNAGNVRIFGSAHSSGNSYEFRTYNGVDGNPLVFYLCDGVSCGSVAVNSLTYNKWTSVCFNWEYSGGTTTMKSYKNGAYENTATLSGQPSMPDIAIYIGRYSNTLYLNGTIDEFMIFDRALSDNEVTALYNLDLS
jgi:hypothetical protein